MAETNGTTKNENGAANGGSKSSAISVPNISIPKPGAKQDLPQCITKDPYVTIPHISTYAGRYNEVNKTYYQYFDEALRNSQANTLAFRRDGFTQELLNHRRLPLLSLPFHMETDDPEHPDQVSISEMVQKIIVNIPRLKVMMSNLMEAIFYGRYGSQIQLGPRKVGGNEWTSITKNIPINGDKLRYKWDGTPGIAIYAGDRDPKSDNDTQTRFLKQNEKYIQTTMLGPALFLETQALKDRFIIHNFEGSDTDYLFEIDESQSIFGVGLRSRLYWTWNLRTEIWSWIVDSLQRIGASGLIYGFYPNGNAAAQREALNSLSQLVKDNIGVFPVPAGYEGKLSEWLQRIEPSPVGYEVMERLVDKLDGIMRRAFLGQDLSSESKPTGLGGGAANLHSDVRMDTIKYDAEMLAETLTEQLVSVIVRYNTWKYEGEALRGDDLPFSLKWVFDIDDGSGAERLAAAQILFQMGVELDKDEVRKAAGFSPPKKKANILTNPELEMQKQQNQAGVPQYDQAAEHLKGIVGQGKEAQKLGMMGGQGGNPKPSGASRFLKSGGIIIDDPGYQPRKIDWDKELSSRFSKDFKEGDDSILSTDKTLSRSQVGKVLSEQYYNKKAGYSADEMADKWLESSSFKLLKDVPIWTLKPYKYEAPDDLSYSKGPLIVDGNKRNRKLPWGSFGSDPELVICDGKHRYWMAIRSGKKTYDCFVGDAIYEDMKQYIEEFSPKRSAFIRAVHAYYRENNSDSVSKFAKAGDADDCGHNPSGGFSDGNTCAGEGGTKEIKSKYNYKTQSNKEDYNSVCDYVFGKKLHVDEVLGLCGAEIISSNFQDFEPSLRVSSNKKVIGITFRNENIEIDRIISKDKDGNIYISNSSFRLGIDSRGGSIAIDIFSNQVKSAIKLGVKKIYCSASGDNKDNGYYTWPRFGYDGPVSKRTIYNFSKEISSIVGQSEEYIEENDIKVSSLMKTEVGRKFWRERGGTFQATFDLSEGSQSRQVLDAYLKEKGK